MKRLILISMSAVLFSACATTPPPAFERRTRKFDIGKYQERPEAEGGSLYVEGKSFFEDERPSRVGDVVVVRIMEADSASHDSSAQLSRDAKMDMGISGSLTKLAPEAGLTDLFGYSNSSSMDGSGAVRRKGEIKAVETDTLKAMLPDTIGGFARTGFSTMAMGVAGSGVEGDYKANDQQFSLKVQDMLALSGLAGIGSAMGIEQEKEDENGYERIGTVDGQWREERWNNGSSSGTYAVMIADRFRVEASGNVANIDVLKAAVASIDAGDLQDLAE